MVACRSPKSCGACSSLAIPVYLTIDLARLVEGSVVSMVAYRSSKSCGACSSLATSVLILWTLSLFNPPGGGLCLYYTSKLQLSRFLTPVNKPGY